MPASPEISVVIAAWNAAGTIDAAVRSALDQQDVSVEVVVVDDASPDAGAAIVASIGDPRVRLIRLENNRGPGGARNAGFAAATGKWIAVLDSDDLFAPGRLRRMLARANTASADIVIDNLEVLRADAPPAPTFPVSMLAPSARLTLPDFIRSNIVFKSIFNLGYTKPMFSRAFIERHAVRYDEGLSIGEDYLFLADCLAYGATCAREPQAGYRYFIRAGSISRKLEAAVVERIVAGDRRFLARHDLQGDALAAQRDRDKAFGRAVAFLKLIDAMKAKRLGDCLAIVGANPAALGLMRMPIAARWKRLIGQQA